MPRLPSGSPLDGDEVNVRTCKQQTATGVSGQQPSEARSLRTRGRWWWSGGGGGKRCSGDGAAYRGLVDDEVVVGYLRPAVVRAPVEGLRGKVVGAAKHAAQLGGLAGREGQVSRQGRPAHVPLG